MKNRKISIFTCLLLLFACSCKIVNLDPFLYRSYPESRNAIIRIQDNVWIDFPPLKNIAEVESGVEIFSKSGLVDCNYRWEENRLVLSPFREWVKGQRYRLIINSPFYLKDGRQFNEKRIIPFFAGKEQNPPSLQSHDPSDEAIVHTGKELLFRFTEPMNRDSFEQKIKITPFQDFEYEWSKDRQFVTIRPSETWQPLVRYTVHLSQEIVSSRGAEMNKEYTFNFRTKSERPVLTVSVPYSIKNNVPLWKDTLNNINNTKGLYLEFNQAVKMNSLKSTISIKPLQKYQLVVISKKAFAIIPDEPWIPEQRYTLTLSREFSNLSDLKIESPLEIIFKNIVSEQKIKAVKHSHSNKDNLPSEFNSPQTSLLLVGEGTERSHSFTLVLEEPLQRHRLGRFVESLNLRAISPSTLTQPILNAVYMSDSKKITLVYSGFSKPPFESKIQYFYRLSQSNSREKTINDDGSYIVNSWSLLYRVEGK